MTVTFAGIQENKSTILFCVRIVIDKFGLLLASDVMTGTVIATSPNAENLMISNLFISSTEKGKTVISYRKE